MKEVEDGLWIIPDAHHTNNFRRSTTFDEDLKAFYMKWGESYNGGLEPYVKHMLDSMVVFENYFGKAPKSLKKFIKEYKNNFKD